jgi:hypothetical protein
MCFSYYNVSFIFCLSEIMIKYTMYKILNLLMYIETLIDHDYILI